SAVVPLPPATSSLFPYTTLFRSIRRRKRSRSRKANFRRHDHATVERVSNRKAHQPAAPAAGGRPPVRASGFRVSDSRRGNPAGGDRKSTRLNSSHSQISYAVFCL